MDDILNQINDYDDYDDYDFGVKSGSSSSQDLQDFRSEPYLMHNAFNKPKQNSIDINKKAEKLKKTTELLQKNKGHSDKKSKSLISQYCSYLYRYVILLHFKTYESHVYFPL